LLPLRRRRRWRLNNKPGVCSLWGKGRGVVTRGKGSLSSGSTLSGGNSRCGTRATGSGLGGECCSKAAAVDEGSGWMETDGRRIQPKEAEEMKKARISQRSDQ
jgi:hypothetical protein